jgi:hypothetical protein
MNKLIHVQVKNANRFDVYDNRNGSVLGEIVRDTYGVFNYHPESSQQVIGEVTELEGAILTEVSRLNSEIV